MYERETIPADELKYTETPVPPALAPYIRSLWHLRGDARQNHDWEPVVPDGCVELVFNHCIRDCRDLASCSPSQLRTGDHALTESFLSQ